MKRFASIVFALCLLVAAASCNSAGKDAANKAEKPAAADKAKPAAKAENKEIKKEKSMANAGRDSAQAVADAFCEATVKGDIKGVFDLPHPAMMKKMLEEVAQSGMVPEGVDVLEFMQKQYDEHVKTYQISKCETAELFENDCAEDEIAYLANLSLEPEQCYNLDMTVIGKNNGEDFNDNNKETLVRIDGKYYVISM